MGETETVMQFWGKARPAEGAVQDWHPLLWHMLDVAACAELVLAREPDLLRLLSGMLQIDEARLGPFLVWLAAAHDLGKFSVPFQAKVPGRLPEVLAGAPQIADRGHDGAALELWSHDPDLSREWARRWGMSPRHLRALVGASFGHHGAPAGIGEAGRQAESFPPASRQAVDSTLENLWALVGGKPVGPVASPGVPGASFAIAGLVTLSDWLGSHQPVFAYETPGRDPESYMSTIARPRAVRMLDLAGVGLTRPARPAGYQDLLARPGFEPTPLQHWAASVAIPEGPALFILEDATGAGKTEAAMMLTHRLMAAGRARGIYVAMPTMATANAMFGRMATVFRNFFDPGGTPSLALAHGRSNLDSRFRTAVETWARQSIEGGSGSVGAEVTASAACAAWFADDRRRSLLADIGVGTIDQALLAVFPARHQSLRLLGLAGKVLVVDEVHACDPYVRAALEVLLKFHGILGGSAILLSATLPAMMRAGLEKAWTGREAEGTEGPAAPWPRAHRISTDGADRTAIAPRPLSIRKVEVRRLDTVAAAVSGLQAVAIEGACGVWIRNSVMDAIEAAGMLQAAGTTPLLFHARFALCDRLERETEILRLFGPSGTAADRGGRILVATQVVEQSLDLDFDHMVSDLAPADLLIQRAGRLHRHYREGRTAAPVLDVLSPDPRVVAGSDWLRGLLLRTSFVYGDDAALWRTADVLFGKGRLSAPDEIRAIIEHVFGPDALDLTPEALRGAALDAAGRTYADRSTGQSLLLDPAAGYVAGQVWQEPERVRTRLGEPQSVLRLARVEHGQLHPWCRDETGHRAWMMSEIGIAQRLVGSVDPEAGDIRLVEAVKRGWRDWERQQRPVLPLRETAPGFWSGQVKDGAGRPRTALYDRSRGLRIILKPADDGS